MPPSPMKRILTDDERATALASQFQRSDATSTDLAASIRAASMRVRKSLFRVSAYTPPSVRLTPFPTCLAAVTEGYQSSPPSSPLKQAPVALTGAAGYPLAARESIRQVFSPLSGCYSPLSSPSKRKRAHPDSHDDDEQSITPSFITLQSPDRCLLAAELSGDDMQVDRPMKPLRRSGRIRQVSPPPIPSLFPCETEMNAHQPQQDLTNTPSTQLLSPDPASDNEQQ